MSRLWKMALTFLGVGFAGLGITRLVADHYFGGEKEFLHTHWGSVVVMTFSFIWLVGLLALLPAAIVREKQQLPKSEMTIYSWWQWLLLIPYFAHDNNAKVPRWIWMPLFAVALLLAAFIFIVLVAIGLHQLST